MTRAEHDIAAAYGGSTLYCPGCKMSIHYMYKIVKDNDKTGYTECIWDPETKQYIEKCNTNNFETKHYVCANCRAFIIKA